MSKTVKILLTRPLNVNLGRDENGQVKSVQLHAGFQEVEQEVAENWFVKAHCQEITTDDVQNAELQMQLDKANEDLVVLQAQSDAATAKIIELESSIKERDQKIKDLEILVTKAEQSQAQSDAAKSTDTSAADTAKTTKAK
ncbi:MULTISPECIES: STY1053 family phage-associated protein [unclassified Acinetobacter]|uniref:STY1053 family phage-associated protein n=1 Tax=unclassified Acinetobacter TaxID=196816 RepID=UPI00190CC6DA|nr:MULTISPECIES: hypothetical protein [unclassified Acinetobacter]MBK0062157.1 hypothetical protein [Acinetobacter sp. S55]MBK0065961.1 hypothetical protein [Acinetobacter sp. S54]